MKTLIPCELRDLDGTYVLVEPVGEIRCRVLASNVARKGEVLYKPETLSWSQASRDLGGFTRLSPAELLGTVAADNRPDPDNLLEAMDCHEEIRGDGCQPDPEGDLVDPTTLPTPDGDLEPDAFQAELFRIVIHYRRKHARKDGEKRWVTKCDCLEFCLPDQSANARLHLLISMGLLQKQVPTLPWILKAMENAKIPSAAVA